MAGRVLRAHRISHSPPQSHSHPAVDRAVPHYYHHPSPIMTPTYTQTNQGPHPIGRWMDRWIGRRTRMVVMRVIIKRRRRSKEGDNDVDDDEDDDAYMKSIPPSLTLPPCCSRVPHTLTSL